MEWMFYALIGLIGAALTGTAVVALYWSSRHGQLRNFDRGAGSIFDDEEPVGQMTDHFPEEKKKARTPAQGVQ